MPRYFVQVAYNGANYAGFQIQQNANSVQAEVEKALAILFKVPVTLTCSSRTDSGVHALDNYFHFDATHLPPAETLARNVYSLNAILPRDIVIKSILPVNSKAHCRFDALSREYDYFIYQHKDPFLEDRAYYYPYGLNMDKLREAATALTGYTDFTSFSKRNTQVKTFECSLYKSSWARQGDCIVYTVKGNRFLRGMVRGLVGTMLRVGTGKTSMDRFLQVIENRNPAGADFSVPPQGLFLKEVIFPTGIFLQN